MSMRPESPENVDLFTKVNYSNHVARYKRADVAEMYAKSHIQQAANAKIAGKESWPIDQEKMDESDALAKAAGLLAVDAIVDRSDAERDLGLAAEHYAANEATYKDMAAKEAANAGVPINVEVAADAAQQVPIEVTRPNQQ